MGSGPQDLRNADVAVCTAERADANFPAGHDNKTFAQYYGTNDGQNNAFGKCVSAKAKAS